MHIGTIGNLLLALASLSAIASIGAYAFGRQGSGDTRKLGHLLTYGVFGFTTLAIVLLAVSFLTENWALQYVVYNHPTTVGPWAWVYRLSGVWAGREGSLLFWEWVLAVYAAFIARKFMKEDSTLGAAGLAVLNFVQLFFLAALFIDTNNPFKPTPAGMVDPATGALLTSAAMNPLLQTWAMVLHPPTLFVGYAGLAVPFAFGLAALFTGDVSKKWVVLTDRITVFSWLLLGIGIGLGSVWAYYELAFGGYWAWDPVENASLIPWFSATAFLHTAHIEVRRGALARTNVLLMALTFLLCVFGTYLVRSGVIESLHAFGEGGVGSPLMLFMLGGLGISVLAVLAGDRPVYRALSDMWSRQGLLLVASWFFLALGLVVAMATMWPVISKLWSATSVGLGPEFYNRVCVPLLSLLVLLFCLCPWLDWKVGLREKRGLIATGAVFVLSLAGFALAGVTKPVALFSAAAAVTAMASCVLLFVLLPQLRRSRHSFGAYGVHLAVAVMALGIAFSGPYKVEQEAALSPGQSLDLSGYTVTFLGTEQERTSALSLVRASLRVTRDGKEVGVLLPERRLYRNFPQPFAEAAVLPGLGDELYATLLGFNDETNVSIKISVNPLVNWVWIGGTLLCLAPLLLLRRKGEA